MKKKKQSGPSGKNVSPVLRVPVSEAERTAYTECAELKQQPFAAWARDAMNARAKSQGHNPSEKLNNGKTNH